MMQTFFPTRPLFMELQRPPWQGEMLKDGRKEKC